MPTVPVHSIDIPALAPYRSTRDAAALRAHGLFVAEGRLVVVRVLDDPSWVVESMLLSPAAYDALRAVIEARRSDVPVYVCPSSVLADVTGVHLHRGCLALVRRPSPLSWEAVAARATRLLVLDGLTDADNVGSAFRNAAAFGVDALLLTPGTCDPLYRKAVRTSMGHVLRLPWATVTPWPDALDALHRAGWQTVVLTPRQPSVPLETWVSHGLAPRVALVVGTEGAGVSDAVAGAAMVRVRIPMATGVDSLNVATAAAVVLSRVPSCNREERE